MHAVSCTLAERVRVTRHRIANASHTVYFTDSLTAAWNALSSFTGTCSLMESLDDGGENGTRPTAAGILKRYSLT